jgi:hypothetical protein
MQGENGLLIDLRQVGDTIPRADVFAVGFPGFEERLLVDTRSNHEARPLVRVVAPLGSVQERYTWLARERPSFGPPENFVFFVWPHSIGYFVESGLWQLVLDLVDACDDSDVERQCNDAFDHLSTLERNALMSALRGSNHVSLWPPEPAQASH